MKTTTHPEDLISQSQDQHMTHRGSAVTMSSREIAELTGKAHDNVLRDIRMLVKGGVLKTEDTPYTHQQNGQQYPEFLLRKRDTLVLVSGYDAHLRAKIIDRWMDLESLQAPRIPQTLAEALRFAAGQAEIVEQQERALAIAAPKAEFVDRYVDGTGLKSFRQVCKIFNAKENTFRAFLKEKRVMYRLGKEWVPFAEHVHAGRLTLKTDQASNGHTYSTARFTPKGVMWVSLLWDDHQREVAA